MRKVGNGPGKLDPTGKRPNHFPQSYMPQTSVVKLTRCVTFKMEKNPMSSHANSELISASQYNPSSALNGPRINYFVIPVFILETIGLGCLAALFYYLRFTDVFPYHRRYFFCNDQSLQYPNLAPEQFIIYVSKSTLYSVCFLVPPIVMLLGEVMYWMFSTKPRKPIYAHCVGLKIHLITRRVFRFLGTFLFGALIVSILIDAIKLMTGFHRPYFLSDCRPNMTLCGINRAGLCTVPYGSDLREAALTFPSLYAGLSFYAAVFTACYIQSMIKLRGAPLLRPSLIFGFIGMALIASFSRIQGYKNHWLDVWVGWFIGLLCALYLCFNVNFFQEAYRIPPKKEAPPRQEVRVPPFFSWFRLPRVRAPSVRQPESLYSSPTPAHLGGLRRVQRDRDTSEKNYEVTTTTEHFERTIIPPGAGMPKQAF